MKKIEWFALTLIVLWVVALTVPKWLYLFVLPTRLGVQELNQVSPFTTIIIWSQFLITRIVNIGVAVWLFLTTRRNKETPWVWALFGLTYGIFAALLLFVLRTHNQLQHMAVANKQIEANEDRAKRGE